MFVAITDGIDVRDVNRNKSYKNKKEVYHPVCPLLTAIIALMICLSIISIEA